MIDRVALEDSEGVLVGELVHLADGVEVGVPGVMEGVTFIGNSNGVWLGEEEEVTLGGNI